MRALRLSALVSAIVLVLLLAVPPAGAQAVLTTLQVISHPQAIAVNPITNKIYASGTLDVNVIDGATNQSTDVFVGGVGYGIAVNTVTNKIYVACQYTNQLVVIDGATNQTTSVAVGLNPVSIAVNTATNKIYVVNNGDNTVTVVDGATLQTTSVMVGPGPMAIAVNAVANRIYVTNPSDRAVTMIDGDTNQIGTLSVGFFPVSIAVNTVTNRVFVVCEGGLNSEVDVFDSDGQYVTSVEVGFRAAGIGINTSTNKIYVYNECTDVDLGCFTGSLSVIDGDTYQTSVIPDLPVSSTLQCRTSLPWCPNIVVDSQSDKIYLALRYSNVLSVVDGARNTVLNVGLGYGVSGVALNHGTDRLYTPNNDDSSISVVSPDAKLQFVPVTPCRLVDTRNSDGIFGGPPIQGGSSRSFPLPQGSCNIPATAVAYSLNVTAVPMGPLGYMTLYPTFYQMPSTSTLNSLDGRVKAVATITQAGVAGAVSVYASNTSNVVLDINGYFIPSGSSTLAFFPLTPCRVIDTRNPNGDLGGPYLRGGTPRAFPVLEARSCDIPDSARAYSLNVTAVPRNHQPLGYLTVWQAGQLQPQVSTLNAPTGTVVANAAIVAAGTGGSIEALASNDTNLIVDIDGYFAPANTGGNPLALYTLQSCRVVDTRNGRGGEFVGEIVFDILEGGLGCPISDQTQAYVFNTTVVPTSSLGYLTLWPDDEPQPAVSTLNALDGAITSNMAIVPAGNGLVDAYASNLTQLLLDISGYFAP